jgi:hypothetical protein
VSRGTSQIALAGPSRWDTRPAAIAPNTPPAPSAASTTPTTAFESPRVRVRNSTWTASRTPPAKLAVAV